MSDQPTVAILGAGEMGAAVGRRLLQNGAHVRTSLRGRGPASAVRAQQAGVEITDDDAELLRDADFVLSIVPPGVAVQVAERVKAGLAAAGGSPIFADCNAVAPATARIIEDVMAGSGCRYVDAGIIGGPPPIEQTTPGPRFYASGPSAREFARLGAFGLDIAVLDGPIGAASALKLSYAGLTKGIIALGTAMVGAAERAGLAEALRLELARTQPQILARLGRQIPGAFPKAYRWVAEMQEIAKYLGDEAHGAAIYQGVARLYEKVAAENAHRDSSSELHALVDFCTEAIDLAGKKSG
jgi:putative dehydrogenase